MTPPYSLIDRFKEPSSWVALATAATGLGVNVPSGWVQTLSFFGAGVACLAGILLREGTPK